MLYLANITVKLTELAENTELPVRFYCGQGRLKLLSSLYISRKETT